MGLTVKGVRLANLSFEKDSEGHRIKPTGEYEIVTEDDMVLAKQSFNSYNGIKITFMPDVFEAVKNLQTMVQRDIQTMLGFKSE